MDLNCTEEDDFVILGKGPDETDPTAAAVQCGVGPDLTVNDGSQGHMLTVSDCSPDLLPHASVQNPLTDTTETTMEQRGGTSNSHEHEQEQHRHSLPSDTSNSSTRPEPETQDQHSQELVGDISTATGPEPGTHDKNNQGLVGDISSSTRPEPETQDQHSQELVGDISTATGPEPETQDQHSQELVGDISTATEPETGTQDQNSHGLIGDISTATGPEPGAQDQHSQELVGDISTATGPEPGTQVQNSQCLVGDINTATGPEPGTQVKNSQSLVGDMNTVTRPEPGTQDQNSQGLVGDISTVTGPEPGRQGQHTQDLVGDTNTVTGLEPGTQGRQGLVGDINTATGPEPEAQDQHSQGLVGVTSTVAGPEQGVQGTNSQGLMGSVCDSQETVADLGTDAGKDQEAPNAASATSLIQEDEVLESCSIKLAPYYNRIMITLQMHQQTGAGVDSQYKRTSKKLISKSPELAYRIPSQRRWKFVSLTYSLSAGAPVYKGMICNLNPGVTYEIFVQSVKPSGQREAISLFRSTSYVGPPSRVGVGPIDGEEAAVVSWQAPVCLAPGVALTGYTLKTVMINPLQDDNGQIDEAFYTPSTTAVKVPIDPTKSYTFQVRAHCTRDVSDEKEVELMLLKHVVLRQSVMAKTKGKPSFQIELRHNERLSSVRFPLLELGYPTGGVKMNEKVILVIGATGAGKTTLINGLINYVLGVEYSDPYRFKLVTEAVQDNAMSVTKNITTYTLHHRIGFKIPYTLTVIDTPGFGDTAGIVRDKEIAGELFEFFKSEKGLLDRINAVGFVASASTSRLTPTQQYIFDSILALFGKDIKENIYLLLTFADGKPPQILSAIRAANFPNNGYFKFNNSAILDDIGTGQQSGDVSEAVAFENEEEEEGFNKMFWDLGMRSFEKFLDKIKHIQPKSLTLTKQVLEQRERIELYIEELHVQVKLGLQKQEQLIQEKKILRDHAAQINSAKDFKYQVTEAEVIKLPIKDAKSTTTCLECNYTCHADCAYHRDEDKHKCVAMDPNTKDPVRCKICVNKCPWDVHKNTKYHYVTRQVQKTKTSADLKARYEYAKGQHVTVKQLIDDIMDEFEGIEGKIVYAIVEIRASLNKLKDIALKENPLSTVEYIDTLILSEQNQKQPGWFARVEQLQELRENAKAIHDIAKDEYDPFEDYRDEIEERRGKGVNFKDKKFWTKAMKEYKPKFEKRCKTKKGPCRIQ